MKRLAISIGLLLFLAFSFAGCKGGEPTEKKIEKAAKSTAPKPRTFNEVRVEISEADKQYLMKTARKAFDLWVAKEERYEPNDVPPSLKGKKSNNVFATIYKEGEWRGCVSASGKDLVANVVNAVINTCRDKRFKDPLPEEIDRFRVEISILQPKELIEDKTPEGVRKVLEPGVHGIYLEHSSRKRAFFLPYVFVKKQRTTVTWLERIAKKAKLPKDAWKSPETFVYKYATINFIEDVPHGKAVDLYRYKVELDEPPADAVEKAIDLAEKYLLGHKVEEKSRFLPGYDVQHRPLRTDPDAWQLSAAAALGYAADLAKDLKLGGEVRWVMKGLESGIRKAPEGGRMFGSDSGVDGAATLIFAELLGCAGAVKDRRELAASVAEYLRNATGKDKRLPMGKAAAMDPDNHLVFAMARLASVTKNEKDKQHARLLFDAFWKSGGRWALLAVAETANLTGDAALATKAVEEGRKVVGMQYDRKSAPYADFTGAFNDEKTPTTANVAVRLRGLALAYSLVPETQEETRKRLLNAVVLAARWLLEQQFTPASAFYLEEYSRYVGAFKKDILVNTTELDDTALALLALLDVNRFAEKPVADAFVSNKEMLKK